MNIVGSGKKVIDADLLARLALDKQSGATVSKAEVKEAIEGATTDLKDEFSYSTSSRGLTRDARAIANTLQLAVDSGWVRGGSAKDLIEAFVDGAGDGSLDDVMKEIKAEVRENRDDSVGYGGYTSTVSYSGGGGGSSNNSYSGT